MKPVFKDMSCADIPMIDTSIMDAAIRDLSRRLAADQDAIIRAAISRRIVCHWTIEGVLPRLRWEQEKGHPEKTLLLDGEPLITMWPPENTTEGNEMRWTIKYKEHVL